jgi:DNA-binding XRE family transcriptional regulator
MRPFRHRKLCNIGSASASKFFGDFRSEFRTFGMTPLPIVPVHDQEMKNPRNLVGPQIRKLRSQQGLTQPMLAARCRRWGWDLSRETLAKIETQLRWVADFEILCLARALRAEPGDLWPAKDKIPKALQDFFERLAVTLTERD